MLIEGLWAGRPAGDLMTMSLMEKRNTVQYFCITQQLDGLNCVSHSNLTCECVGVFVLICWAKWKLMAGITATYLSYYSSLLQSIRISLLVRSISSRGSRH